MPAGAVRGNVFREGEHLFVPAVPQQICESVSTRASAFRALDPQHVELADQIAEDDGAIAGQRCSLI
jgi:hypothetical protein